MLSLARETPHDAGRVATHDRGSIEHPEFDEVLAQHGRDGARSLDEHDALCAARKRFDAERARAAE